MPRSKKTSNSPKSDINATGKAHTDDDNATADNSTTAANLPPTALSTEDPIALTTTLEAARIKSFLYKIEPNMPRISADALELISTTATLLLKSIVDKTVQEEEDERNKKGRYNDHSKEVLLRSNRIKGAVLNNKSLGFDFLEDTYENFRARDVQSRYGEYIPKAKKRNQIARAKQKALEDAKPIDKEHNTNNKRLKQTIESKGSSSLLLSSERANDATPIEKAITEAAIPKESITMDKIIEDDDDYD